MRLSVILMFSHTVLEIHSWPLNAFQKHSGVFLLQTSILLMVIWDQISSSVKVFSDRVTEMILFWFIYNNKKAYSVCVFCTSTSCGDDSLKSTAKSKKKSIKKKKQTLTEVKTLHKNDRNVIIYLLVKNNMNFRNIKSDCLCKSAAWIVRLKKCELIFCMCYNSYKHCLNKCILYMLQMLLLQCL